ncbi:DUF2877 domain-containing protein [Microbacterium sp. USHLN186]|uniref:DUF2877 domain-containing protein n=1 Tax=Microbacterium sp. USHLN186 TaxID=3081286 RepID=UPI0030185CC7
MTPVATPVALRAHTWDAALEETLSGGSDAPVLGIASAPRIAAVHSVHTWVVNIRCGDDLIALAHQRLDDAPWTVRIAHDDWPALTASRVDDAVALSPGGITLSRASGAVRIGLAPDAARRLMPAEGAPAPSALRRTLEILSAIPSPAAATPFGALAADALAAGIRRLRVSARQLLDAPSPEAADAVARSADRLIGLGEGLTPSGDDVLTGLAFVAAHPGLALRPLLDPLSTVAAAAEARTTLLSAVTLRAALDGRARLRMHDLLLALIDADEPRLRDAIIRTAAIGHTSGYDILTGIRLGLELARDAPTGPAPTLRTNSRTEEHP